MRELTAAIAGLQEHESEQVKTDEVAFFRWEPVIYFYCLYFSIIWVGEIVHFNGASSLGAALFLVFFYVKYWRFLFKLKADLLMLCIILCLVLPLIPVISFDETMIIKAYQELIKYYALYFIILVGLSLPLTPLTQARRTWLLYSVILTFLLTGWLSAPLQVSAPDMYTTSTRVKGYLVNGNVFALVAMVLLFLVDQDRTGKLVNGMNHAVILFLIYLSHTSGAILGYAVGMLYRFIYGNRRFLIVRGMAVAVGIILAAIIFVSIPPNTFKVVDDTTEKLNIAFDYIDRVRANNVIDFYGIIERKGRDVTSAVWRLYYWNNILKKFWDSSLDKILFGYGIGTMETVLGAKAHNDYLRFLFQTGLIGLVLNMTIWGMLYRRMELKYRWVVIMIAVFCVSENNYDNFPAMSMLAFYMLGARRSPEEEIVALGESP